MAMKLKTFGRAGQQGRRENVITHTMQVENNRAMSRDDL